jgi:hypothetical protein
MAAFGSSAAAANAVKVTNAAAAIERCRWCVKVRVIMGVFLT